MVSNFASSMSTLFANVASDCDGTAVSVASLDCDGCCCDGTVECAVAVGFCAVGVDGVADDESLSVFACLNESPS